MKPSTQKLLLSLFPTGEDQIWLDYSQIKFLTPELTAAGRRSLVAQLKQKSLIIVEHLARTQIRLTNHGQSAAKSQFLALSEERRRWQGEWSLVVFLEAPRQDANFRYLRSSLLQHKAIPLTRGNYLYPGALPEVLRNLLYDLYRDNVALFQVQQNGETDIPQLIAGSYVLSDVFQTYSGISKELDILLRKKQPIKELTDGQKNSLYLVFNRFFTALLLDPGLTSFYFPNSPSPLDLLSDWQELLTA